MSGRCTADLQRAGSKLSISVTREGHGQVEVSEAGGEVRSQQNVRGLDVAVSNWWFVAPNSRLVQVGQSGNK